MSHQRIAFGPSVEHWPCPWCRKAADGEDGEPVYWLHVIGGTDWWCPRCGRMGGELELPELELRLRPGVTDDLLLASLIHSGPDAMRQLYAMAARLLRQWDQAGEPRAALEVLLPWAQAHIRPVPDRLLVEHVLEQCALRRLRSA